MENNTNSKVLVVMDGTYTNERSDKDYERLESMISSCLANEGYEVDFRVLDTFMSEYDFDMDAERIMKEVDELSAYTCMNDYVCIIAEGVTAWFWLQAMYEMPILCINPVVDFNEEYQELMSDELKYILDDIYDSRGFQTEQCMCVISNEHYNDIEEYDNVFTDNTVIRSDYDFESEDFWTDTHSLIKALKYIIDHYYE